MLWYPIEINTIYYDNLKIIGNVVSHIPDVVIIHTLVILPNGFTNLKP